MCPDIPDKVYFKIGEVSQIVGVETHVLRFWETEFKIKPERATSKQRLYTRKHLDLFLEIKRLLYEELYTISGAKKRLTARAGTLSPTDPFLTEIKARLLEIKLLLEDHKE